LATVVLQLATTWTQVNWLDEDPDAVARHLLQTLARLWKAEPAFVLLVDADGVTSVLVDDRYDREAIKDALAAWAVNGWNASKSL